MRFAHVWFCSERDRATLAVPRSGVLPNIVEVSDDLGEDNTQSVTRDSKVVLMVGSLWYGPNRAGIEWFRTLLAAHSACGAEFSTETGGGGAP